VKPTLSDTLDGQVALVTGANRGIGREIARGLADLDATVYAGVRDADHDVPAGTTAVELDLTEEPTLERAVEAVVEDAGRLDVLVNNAGVGGTGEPLESVGAADLDHVLDVNLRGALLLTKHALPHLLETDAPRVVNLSSGLGVLSDPIPGEAPVYRASKSGINALTASLEVNHAEDGMLANSADPGWVATDLGGSEAPRDPETGAETPIWLSRFAPGSPSGRFWKDRKVIEF